MIPRNEPALINSPEVRELKKLVNRGEGQHLEFKRKANHPEKIVKEFVAFANANGGVLLVGVDDDKTLAGVKYPDEESHTIRKALQQCKPAIQFSEEVIPLNESRSIVCFSIPESSRKPHYHHEPDGKHAYVRVDDKCMKASAQLCEVLKRSQKVKGVQFIYGEQEKLLMQFLEVHKTITLHECALLLKINNWKASRKLILLVLADVLRLTPTEKGDIYSRK